MYTAVKGIPNHVIGRELFYYNSSARVLIDCHILTMPPLSHKDPQNLTRIDVGLSVKTEE